MTLAIMNRQQLWPVVGALLMVCGWKLHAQQADLRASAAAKAAAGREALTHAATDVPGPNAIGIFIKFDVPGAVNGIRLSISPAGAITGYYLDANYVSHSFLRASNGTLTPFDVPGDAGTIGAQAVGINAAGAVTGSYYDANVAGHGFLRAPDGKITPFDVPGAGTGFFQGTVPFSINLAGAITGTYYDGNDVSHGFLRAPDGKITPFDVPGAGTINGVGAGFFVGTQAVGINPAGVIAGIYTDANGHNHGFLRASNGVFTTFDPPGRIETFAPFSFGPDLSINPEGVITGTYFAPISGNPFGGNFRVFVRAPDGAFTTFDAATYPPCCIWSFPSGINQAGEITGSYNDGFTINHGFLRASNRTITTFDVPGAGTGFNQGTVPLGINPAGVIMGFYIDGNYGQHSFLLLPRP